MPITKSAIRAERKAKKNRAANINTQNQYKAAIKDAESLIAKKSTDAGKMTSKAFSLIDKAAKVRVISKQKAARLKSSLAKKMAKNKIKSAKRKIEKTNKVSRKVPVKKPTKKKVSKKKPAKKTKKS